MIVSCLVSPFFGGGIARHTEEMVKGLAASSDVECRLLMNLRDARRKPGFLAGVSAELVQPLPLRTVAMERLWKIAGWPAVDSFVRGSDVVYCPANARIPAKTIPTVMTVHDVQALEPHLPWSREVSHQNFRRRWLLWLPRAAQECTRILTVSEFSKGRLVELAGINPDKIGVVGNGVSEPFFQAGCRLPSRPANRIVVVGGVRTKKGAADTLAVAAALASMGSPLVISVVGQNEPEWESKAAGLPNVHIEGMVDDSRLAALLADSTALLFLSPYEGFGIPAVEAMAAGTVAVVANAASLPEIVGDAGVVVNPSQHATIAHLLEQLRFDHAFREGVVAKGTAHAKQFTWSRCVERLVRELAVAISSTP